MAVSAALAIAGAGLSHVSAAQTAPPSSANSGALETIVVTAEKREESLKDVPMSLTAVGGNTLDDLQARSFADYAALVPGLSLTTGQTGQTRLTLRGQNAGGVGSTVAVYLDESPFGSSTALLNGSINTGDFDTWDMQRIEVLRGPQGTLYGANSEGGLLKFVTNAPQLGKLEVQGEVNGETVKSGGTGGGVRALANLPLGDKVAFRLSGFYDDVAGYIDDPSLGTTDLNKGKKYGGRASILFVPVDALSVRLTAATQKSTYDGTNVMDIDPDTLKPVYGDLKQERAVYEPSSFKYDNYSAIIDWNTGPFKVLSATSYGELLTDTVTDTTPVYGGLAAAFGGTGAPLDGNDDLKKFTQEIRLTSPSTNAFEWQLGAFYTHEKAALDQYLNSITAPGGPYIATLITPIIDSTYQETAGFLDLTYHFNSYFDLQAGGRYSHNSQDFAQTFTYNPAFGVPPTNTDGNSSENVWTYSVAPTVHFDTNTMAYARLATGYRPGGPNVLPPNAPPDVPRTYGSDKTTNVELGMRSTQMDGRLSLDVALFHVDWKNIQLFEVVNQVGINGNGGTAHSQGMEWNFAYLATEGLTFQWTGAYTEAELTSDAPGVGGLSGSSLPWAPKWSTALDAEYKHAAFGSWNGFIGATYSYVGKRSTDFASTTTPTGQTEVGSYNTYDARLGLDDGRYRITLYGKNLSDSRGITNYVSAAAGGIYSSVTVTQPLTVGLSLSAKF
jgi:outer membrane receptor protein involved in Fe transport